MPELTLHGIAVDDTFAEAFGMAATAIVVTADTPRWAAIAAASFTGFATSVIGCGVEAGIDRTLEPEDTPDGRPGMRILLFGFDRDGLARAARPPRRPMHPDQPVLGLLCRSAGPEAAQDGRQRALFRRRLRGRQAARRAAALARAGDGWRVHLRA